MGRTQCSHTARLLGTGGLSLLPLVPHFRCSGVQVPGRTRRLYRAMLTRHHHPRVEGMAQRRMQEQVRGRRHRHSSSGGGGGGGGGARSSVGGGEGSGVPASKADLEALIAAVRSFQADIGACSRRIDEVAARSVGNQAQIRGNQAQIRANARRIDDAEVATRRLWSPDGVEALHTRLVDTERKVMGLLSTSGISSLPRYELRGYQVLNRYTVGAGVALCCGLVLFKEHIYTRVGTEVAELTSCVRFKTG
jgi:hypothetical protein